MTIGEVARRTSLRPSAIRFYESAGVLPVAPRRAGRRIYDQSAVEQLSLVALAQAAGFSLAEIRELLHGFSGRTPASVRWRKLATRKLEEVRLGMERLRAMERLLGKVLDCRCPTLGDCSRAIHRERRRAAERS